MSEGSNPSVSIMVMILDGFRLTNLPPPAWSSICIDWDSKISSFSTISPSSCSENSPSIRPCAL